MKGIYVTIENHWKSLAPDKQYPVIRITNYWFVVRYNPNYTSKYRRTDGYASGDSVTRSKIAESDVERLNAFAESKGGIWDGDKR